MMVELAERCSVGPYLLVKALDPAAFADRFLALHQEGQSSHVAYRFQTPTDRRTLRRFESGLAACRELEQDHLLRVEDVIEDDLGDRWGICPFTGDVDGLRSLSKLLREKGGQMHAFEAERALVQLLEPIALAHGTEPQGRARMVHGPLSMDEVFVDRHGSLFIEWYGLARTIQHGSAGTTSSALAEAKRDEVQSVIEIGYQLLTGLRAEEPLIPPGRLVKHLDPRLDRWFSKGLGTRGFSSAAEALSELPSRAGDEPEHTRACTGWSALSSVVAVRGVISRLRGVRS